MYGDDVEILQAVLQRRDVVAVHRRTELVMQDAGTQSVRRFAQRTIGGFADDAVDQQPAMLLKRADGVVELVVKDVDGDVSPGVDVGVRAVEVTERGQRSPNLGDRRTTVTTA